MIQSLLIAILLGLSCAAYGGTDPTPHATTPPAADATPAAPTTPGALPAPRPNPAIKEELSKISRFKGEDTAALEASFATLTAATTPQDQQATLTEMVGKLGYTELKDLLNQAPPEKKKALLAALDEVRSRKALEAAGLTADSIGKLSEEQRAGFGTLLKNEKLSQKELTEGLTQLKLTGAQKIKLLDAKDAGGQELLRLDPLNKNGALTARATVLETDFGVPKQVAAAFAKLTTNPDAKGPSSADIRSVLAKGSDPAGKGLAKLRGSGLLPEGHMTTLTAAVDERARTEAIVLSTPPATEPAEGDKKPLAGRQLEEKVEEYINASDADKKKIEDALKKAGRTNEIETIQQLADKRKLLDTFLATKDDTLRTTTALALFGQSGVPATTQALINKFNPSQAQLASVNKAAQISTAVNLAFDSTSFQGSKAAVSKAIATGASLTDAATVLSGTTDKKVIQGFDKLVKDPTLAATPALVSFTKALAIRKEVDGTARQSPQQATAAAASALKLSKLAESKDPMDAIRFNADATPAVRAKFAAPTPDGTTSEISKETRAQILNAQRLTNDVTLAITPPSGTAPDKEKVTNAALGYAGMIDADPLKKLEGMTEFRKALGSNEAVDAAIAKLPPKERDAIQKAIVAQRDAEATVKSMHASYNKEEAAKALTLASLGGGRVAWDRFSAAVGGDAEAKKLLAASAAASGDLRGLLSAKQVTALTAASQLPALAPTAAVADLTAREKTTVDAKALLRDVPAGDQDAYFASEPFKQLPQDRRTAIATAWAAEAAPIALQTAALRAADTRAVVAATKAQELIDTTQSPLVKTFAVNFQRGILAGGDAAGLKAEVAAVTSENDATKKAAAVAKLSTSLARSLGAVGAKEAGDTLLALRATVSKLNTQAIEESTNAELKATISQLNFLTVAVAEKAGAAITPAERTATGDFETSLKTAASAQQVDARAWNADIGNVFTANSDGTLTVKHPDLLAKLRTQYTTPEGQQSVRTWLQKEFKAADGDTKRQEFLFKVAEVYGVTKTSPEGKVTVEGRVLAGSFKLPSSNVQITGVTSFVASSRADRVALLTSLSRDGVLARTGNGPVKLNPAPPVAQVPTVAEVPKSAPITASFGAAQSPQITPTTPKESFVAGPLGELIPASKLEAARDTVKAQLMRASSPSAFTASLAAIKTPEVLRGVINDYFKRSDNEGGLTAGDTFRVAQVEARLQVLSGQPITLNERLVRSVSEVPTSNCRMTNGRMTCGTGGPSLFAPPPAQRGPISLGTPRRVPAKRTR